jgi:hypothetical protein
MARDLIHDAVKNALIKDGWTILADPFRIEYEEFSLAADLAAEHPFAIEKHGQKVVVEIKSFAGRSFVKELQQALGQYEMYADFIELTTPEYELYLAVSDVIYTEFFSQRATQLIVQRHHLKILVVDVEREDIISWEPYVIRRS